MIFFFFGRNIVAIRRIVLIVRPINWMLSPSRLDQPCCGSQVQTFLQLVHKKEQDNNHKLVDCCFFLVLSGNPHCRWLLWSFALTNIIAIDVINQLIRSSKFPCLRSLHLFALTIVRSRVRCELCRSQSCDHSLSRSNVHLFIAILVALELSRVHPKCHRDQTS
jgi:hypothetical protein